MNYLNELKKRAVVDGNGFNKNSRPYLTDTFPTQRSQNVLQTNPNLTPRFQYQQPISGFEPAAAGVGQPIVPQYSPMAPVQQYGQMKDIGLQGIQQQAMGKSPYLDLLEQRTRTQMGAAGAAQAGAMGQRMTQQQVDPTTRRAMEMDLSRQQALATGTAAGQIAETRAQQQQQAQVQAAQMGMQAEQVEMAKMRDQYEQLMAAGGLANIEQAEKLFQQMSGGESIDLTGDVRTQAYSTLGAYAQIPGTDIDEVIQMARQNGDMERFGLDEQDVRNMMEPILRSQNPLAVAEAQYKAMLDSGDIDQDQYEDMMAVQKWQLTNPDGLVVRDSYIVTNDSGDEVGNFLTQQEADSYASKHGGSVAFKKNGYIGVKDEYQQFLPAGEGEYFVEGATDEDKGVLYKNVGGERIKVTYDPEDPFSENNLELIEHYGYDSDEKEAKKIKKKMVQAVVNDLDNMPLDFDKEHPLYKDVLESPKVQGIKSLRSFETGTGTASVKKIELFEKYTPGQLINFNGNLLSYQSSNRKKVKGDDDIVYYYFYDPVTKETVEFHTQESGDGVTYPY